LEIKKKRRKKTKQGEETSWRWKEGPKEYSKNIE
jgi:hypothetical protein